MRRSDLNLFLDAYLAFVQSPEKLAEARRYLIELAIESEDPMSLLSSWLWGQRKGLDTALYVKLWFGLGYSELGELYGLSSREIGQILRSQRIALLGSYPPLEQEKKEISGISCFMLEQRMSEWVDSEFEDLSSLSDLREHLDKCPNCEERLSFYRRLQTQILDKRLAQPQITQTEWDQVKSEMKRLALREKIKFFSMTVIGLLILSLAIWIYIRSGDKMPNVYEIKPD